VIHTESFEAKMVQRLSAPNAISANRLSRKVGISQSRLSRWLLAARTVEAMSKERPSDRARQAGAARPAEEKLRIVMAAAALGPDELGAFLRREGVHEAELEHWRAAVFGGAKSALDGGAAKAPARSADAKRIKELERELRRKDRALAETAALLVLQKTSARLGGTGTTTRTKGIGK
jgi:transposase-like protein